MDDIDQQIVESEERVERLRLQLISLNNATNAIEWEIQVARIRCSGLKIKKAHPEQYK